MNMTKYKCKFIDVVRINDYKFNPEEVYDDRVPPAEYTKKYVDAYKAEKLFINIPPEQYAQRQWKAIFDMWKLKNRAKRPTFIVFNESESLEVEKLKKELAELKAKTDAKPEVKKSKK